MIMIWNQRQVLTCSSWNKLCKARQILSDNSIEYTYKAVHHDMMGILEPKKGKKSIFDEKIEYNLTYYLSVREINFEKACMLLENI